MFERRGQPTDRMQTEKEAMEAQNAKLQRLTVSKHFSDFLLSNSLLLAFWLPYMLNMLPSIHTLYLYMYMYHVPTSVKCTYRLFFDKEIGRAFT